MVNKGVWRLFSKDGLPMRHASLDRLSGRWVCQQMGVQTHRCPDVTGNLGSTCPSCSKDNLLTLVVVKESKVLIARHQAKTKDSSCSKDQNSLMAFREVFLKATLGVWVSGCLISSWTLFWLVGGEVTGWSFKNLNHQPLVPMSSESVYLWSAVSIWWESGFCKNNLGMCVRHYYLCLSVRNGRSGGSAIWLIYCLNFYQFPCLTAILCFYMFTFS